MVTKKFKFLYKIRKSPSPEGNIPHAMDYYLGLLFILMIRQTNAIILPFSEMQNILLQTVGK